MADFSASQAIGAGFGVIRRRPLALLAWAVAYAAMAAVLMGLMALLLPDIFRLSREMMAAGAEGARVDSGALMALQGRMMTIQPLMMLGSIAIHTVLVAAIYRAVLLPDDSRFAYLRLGARELWLGLTIVVLYVVMFIALLALFIPVGILVVVLGAAAGSGHGAVFGLLAAILVIACLLGVLWMLLRFSLAPVMAFERRGFFLGESWAMTRGHSWKIFGVALALVVIVMLIETLLGGVMFAAVFGAVGAHGGFAALADAAPADIFGMMAPLMVIGVPVYAVLVVALYVVMAAPFAEIYRELAPETAAV